MALTTLNLAALPVKFVAIPVLAGLAAGTCAVAAYVTAPVAPVMASAPTTVAALPSTSTAPPTAEQATPAKPDTNTKRSCEQQTWPYLDNRCIARSDPARKVRLVMAPRASNAAPRAASVDLVTSDTTLRGPGVAPEANERPAVKKQPKRSETRQQRRDEFRRAYSVYSVPSRSGGRPVIVVRPLRLDAYSSRF